MDAPFVFIGTHKVAPGRLEEFRRWFADFTNQVVAAREPRLLSFAAYADPATDEVTIVQVHPDAESMVHHMSLIIEHVDHAYAGLLERGSRFQVYGTPSAGVLGMIQQLAQDATPPRCPEPFTGFTRLAALTG